MKTLLLGDLNTVETDQQVHNFMNGYALKKLMKEPTCFKSENPRCIDLILTNRYMSFQNTTTFETGHSDFHKVVPTVPKTAYHKAGHTVANHRDYKNFSDQTFKQDLIKSPDLTTDSFQTCFEKVLDEHAKMKNK